MGRAVRYTRRHMTGSPHERVNQKARTRRAIVDAAVKLAEQGRAPTVSEAADAALVGRTTAYRYFPTQDHLLYEAVLGTVPAEIEESLEAHDGSRERLRAVIDRLNARVHDHEAVFRANLRRSLEKIATDPEMDPREARVLGGRRVQWLTEAIEPVRDRLTDEQAQRLTSALALCVGVEPFIVLRDACGLDRDEATALLEWVTETLIAAVYSEAGIS